MSTAPCTSHSSQSMIHFNCRCPFCQRDAFWVQFSGVPVEDAHIIHATTLSAADAGSKADALPALQGIAGASGGSSILPSSPVVTASVAQRQALEAALEAQSSAALALDLQRTHSSPLSHPPTRGQVDSSPLTGSPSWHFQLPHSAAASGQRSGSATLHHAIATAAAASARRHQPDSHDADCFNRYIQRRRGRRSGRGSPRASGGSFATVALPRSPQGGGEDDMDMLERLMVMQAMRASLADGEEVDSAAPRRRSAASANPSMAAQPHEEAPMHGLLQALNSLLQATHDSMHESSGRPLVSPMQTQEGGNETQSRPRRRSGSFSSVDD
jgi:hypothetical protein